VVRRWLSLGLLPEPPWTVQQLSEVRDKSTPMLVVVALGAAHGTWTRWNMGYSWAQCRQLQSDAGRARKRAMAQARLPVEVRQKLLDAISSGEPFRTVLRELELTPNQVWGLAKTDEEWSARLEAALKAYRREDLAHGTNAAYLHGCVCSDCRRHQQIRQGRPVSER
jgi:hypothetical protein